MPTEIVTETCPAPECNLSEKDIERFLDELKNYMELFNPAFQRVEQLKRSTTYLRGLLGNTTRKNIEQMALGLGEKVRSMQYFAGQSPWVEEPVIGIHQQTVACIPRTMNNLPKRWASSTSSCPSPVTSPSNAKRLKAASALSAGVSGFHRWVGWGIIAANLAVMGRAP